MRMLFNKVDYRKNIKLTTFLLSFISFTLRPLLHGPLDIPGRGVSNEMTAIPSWTAASTLMKDV